MNIQHFYDPATFTLTYVVYDDVSKDAVVIDPVLDYNPQGSKVSATSYQAVKAFIEAQQLTVHFVMETHAHADHLSASQLFKSDFPDARIAISEHIKEVQSVFKFVYNLEGRQIDGSQFDYLIADNEELTAGTLSIKALSTPGHTPACLSFVIDDAVFTGDALFMPDYGTGRCDFPKGDAKALYHSVHDVLYALNESTRVFVGHDYQPNNRELQFETTIGESKAHNIQLTAATTEDSLVAFRQTRDATLAAPKLLYPSIQVNIEAGHLPEAESNGKQYLKTPLNIQL